MPAPESKSSSDPTIFISYRRDDAAYVAHMIRDTLVDQLPRVRVFMDIDSIPLGVDFRSHIDEQVRQCNVMLAVIGPNWHGPRGPNESSRIDEPTDFVRLELESALTRGIPVVPVLSATAKHPTPATLPESLKQLAYRQAAEVRPGNHLKAHLQSLARGLTPLLERATDLTVAPPPSRELVTDNAGSIETSETSLAAPALEPFPAQHPGCQIEDEEFNRQSGSQEVHAPSGGLTKWEWAALFFAAVLVLAFVVRLAKGVA